MAVKLKRAEQAALRILADRDAQGPGEYWLLPEATRKTRVALVVQGYAETEQIGSVVTYRITAAGRKAAKIRTCGEAAP